MNIQLRTNTENPFLGLESITCYPDGSSYRAMIVVKSGDFSASAPLFFEPSALRKFIQEVDELTHSTEGNARLQPEFEKDYIELVLHKTGQLDVQGYLSENCGLYQEFRFNFPTDQTCLKPLLIDLNKCLSLNNG